MSEVLYLLQHVDGFYAYEDCPSHWTKASGISQATKYSKEKAEQILAHNFKKAIRDQWRVVPLNPKVKIIAPIKPAESVNIAEILADAQTVSAIYKKYVPRFNQLSKMLSDIEKELLDLEHYVELYPKLNVVKGYRMYIRQKEASEKRRQIKIEKDAITYLIMAPYEELANGDPVEKISALNKEVFYRPRILRELFEDNTDSA